jgi:hypothetical protein
LVELLKALDEVLLVLGAGIHGSKTFNSTLVRQWNLGHSVTTLLSGRIPLSVVMNVAVFALFPSPWRPWLKFFGSFAEMITSEILNTDDAHAVSVYRRMPSLTRA